MLWGDFEAPLDSLAQMSTSVMLPLFNNATVRAQWPDTVAQDLTSSLHKFLSVGAQVRLLCVARSWLHLPARSAAYSRRSLLSALQLIDCRGLTPSCAHHCPC